jgi:hypothetical protein
MIRVAMACAAVALGSSAAETVETGVTVSGVVAEASTPPDAGASYPHYLMKFYLTGLAGPDGKPIGTGDGVVRVLAMHNRKILPVSKTDKGAGMTMRLLPWKAVEKLYGKLQTGSLPTVALEIAKDEYWGELDGQPRLTSEQLARVGQDDLAAKATATAAPSGAPASAAAAASEPAPALAGGGHVASRAESVQDTLEAIERQLAEHGGTWEKWAESLKPYREDLQGCFKLQWPWPAEKGYVFQGAAISLNLADSFDTLPDGERPLDAIVHFNRQLKALGIDLIVAIIPAKLSIYPDYIHTVADAGTRVVRAPADRIVSLAVIKLLHDLLRNDVEVVNLHEEFRRFRLKNGDDVPLFYVRDAHYLNRGAQFAAEKIAERLKRYDFVQKALAGENPYVGEKGARTDEDKADDTLLLIKDRRGQPYSNSGDSPVFVLGDSHLGYNPGTAPFSGQLAYRIGIPVCEEWREGLCAEIPVRVARDPNLKKRRVVVMHYTERMMRPNKGESRWPLVNLPGVADRAPQKAITSELFDVTRAGGVVDRR